MPAQEEPCGRSPNSTNSGTAVQSTSLGCRSVSLSGASSHRSLSKHDGSLNWDYPPDPGLRREYGYERFNQ